jgi:hypothetical protein
VANPGSENSQLARHHGRHHLYALETTGLLIMAALLLGITLVRYWYALHGSLR